MKKIILTEDGSHTIKSEKFNADYHSIHGAIQETKTVFIDAGLNYLAEKGHNNISILEIGFGTGLNIFMTYLEAMKLNISTNIHSTELYPIDLEIIRKMNYPELLNAEQYRDVFISMHQSTNNEIVLPLQNANEMKFKLILADFEKLDYGNNYDLIFFDAFAPSIQPKLWQELFLKKMYDALLPEGVLVTYCAQGAFKRALKSIGFQIESLPGPKGKREMTRAVK